MKTILLNGSPPEKLEHGHDAQRSAEGGGVGRRGD